MNAEVKKRGLGRGLDALFQQQRDEEKAFEPRVKRAGEIEEEARAAAPPPAAAATGQRRVAVDRLSPGKYQPRRRFDEEAIESLARSIAEHGVLQPLLVRPAAGGTFEIIAGERRWRAAQRARVHDLPVIVQDMTDREALEIGLVENLQREDLSAIEEAEGYARLMEEFGHTQEDIAKHLGKSRSHVANTLRLLRLPRAVRAVVQAGQLSAGHARALVGVDNAEALAGMVMKKGLSVRALEKLVQKKAQGGAAGGKGRVFTQKDVDVLALEQKLGGILGLKVSIDARGAQGSLAIEYKTLDQLDDLVARLSRTPD